MSATERKVDKKWLDKYVDKERKTGRKITIVSIVVFLRGINMAVAHEEIQLFSILLSARHVSGSFQPLFASSFSGHRVSFLLFSLFRKRYTLAKPLRACEIQRNIAETGIYN